MGATTTCDVAADSSAIAGASTSTTSTETGDGSPTRESLAGGSAAGPASADTRASEAFWTSAAGTDTLAVLETLIAPLLADLAKVLPRCVAGASFGLTAARWVLRTGVEARALRVGVLARALAPPPTALEAVNRGEVPPRVVRLSVDSVGVLAVTGGPADGERTRGDEADVARVGLRDPRGVAGREAGRAVAT